MTDIPWFGGLFSSCFDAEYRSLKFCTTWTLQVYMMTQFSLVPEH